MCLSYHKFGQKVKRPPKNISKIFQKYLHKLILLFVYKHWASGLNTTQLNVPRFLHSMDSVSGFNSFYELPIFRRFSSFKILQSNYTRNFKTQQYVVGLFKFFPTFRQKYDTIESLIFALQSWNQDFNVRLQT